MIKHFKSTGNALFGYHLVLVKDFGIRIKGNNCKAAKKVSSKDLRQARNGIILPRRNPTEPNYFYQKKLVKKISCTK